jgi:hypothetical protein
MKRILLLVIMVAMTDNIAAQSYNTELNYLSQYIQRMYNNASFQGARVVSDIDKCYLISVVSELATGNDYAIQRKAEVKAMRFANEFLNGTQISSTTILHTEQTSDGYTREEIEDFIESRSMGYVQQMQIISTFIDEQGKKVFVFCKELPMPARVKQKKDLPEEEDSKTQSEKKARRKK